MKFLLAIYRSVRTWESMIEIQFYYLTCDRRLMFNNIKIFVATDNNILNTKASTLSIGLSGNKFYVILLLTKLYFF